MSGQPMALGPVETADVAAAKDAVVEAAVRWDQAREVGRGHFAESDALHAAVDRLLALEPRRQG